MKVLVTGGAGYIGSILVTRLIEQGYKVNVIDDLSTGHIENIDPKVQLYFGSVLDTKVLNTAIKDCKVVFHFAAKSIVSESVQKPQLYEEVNYLGTIGILNAMKANKVKKIIIASTAAVYKGGSKEGLTEESLIEPENPYGVSKLKADHYVSGFCKELGIASITFRFFNVSAPYKSKSLGWIIENHDPETHLIPNIINSQHHGQLSIYGNDWNTPDGTCIRDYLHIKDLTDACLAAVKHFRFSENQIFNLGTSEGNSILEVIASYEKIFDSKIKYKFTNKRNGDVDLLVANARKFSSETRWRNRLNLEDIFDDYRLSLRSK